MLDPLTADDRPALRDARHRLEALVGPVVEGAGAEVHIPPTIPDHELVNALAQYLPLDAVEKQALLERDGVLARCSALIELLEMKVLLVRNCRASAFRQ